MATKNFYINDGLKVKGDTLLNGSSYSDSALSKLHVKTAANGASANLNNVNGLIIENSSSSASYYALKLATGAGNILSVTNSGNVGIGNTTPGGILEISESGTNTELEVSTWSTTDSHNSFLRFQKSASATVNTLAATASGEDLGEIQARGVDTSSTARTAARILFQGDAAPDADAVPGRIIFSTSTASALVERMRIDDAGNVGIGTTTPSTLLTIHQALDTNEGGLRIENSDNSSAFRAWKQPSGGPSVLVDNGVDTLFLKNGDVGIGTTDPNERLTVSGNISASGVIYADAFNSKTGGTTIDFNDDVDLNGNLTFSSSSDILIPDNAGAALEIKEGSNVYQRFITTNGGENIELYKYTTASAGFTANSLSATSLSGAAGAGVTTGATIALGGDLGGSVALDTLGGTKTLTATIQANSVALATDTTGNYVQSLALNTTTPSLTGSSLAAAEGNTITGLGLSATGVTANSYGSTTVIPVITVLEDGRLSSVSTSSIPTDLTIAADSGSNDTVTIGTDTLTFAGTSNEVDTTVSNNQIQIGLPNTVSVTTSLSTPLILGGDGSVSAPSYSFTGDTNTGMWRPGADQLRFNTGGADRLCLTSSLATFTNSVCINDNITVAGNLTVHGACTTLNTTVTATSAFRVDNDGTGPALVANQTGSQPIADFQDDGTSVFYIEDGGNVGLGTTNPEAGLHIYGSGQQALFVGSSNGARALLELDGAANGDGAGGDYAYLAHNADGSFDIKNLQNNSTNFATGSTGTTKMTITSGGNVGIGGITTPESPLQVCGSVNSFQAHFGRQTNGTDCWGGISLGYAENANNSYRKVGIAAKTTGDVHARQELHFLVDSYGDSNSATITDSKMMISSAGDVGIGTTAPGYKLEVSADTNSTVNLLRLRNADATYSQTWDFQSDTNKDLVITGASATGGIKMLPGSRGLVLQDTGGDVKFTLDRTDARTYSLYTESNGSLRIKDEDASTDRISILSGGNVGIGTASPATKLDVSVDSTSDVVIRVANEDNTTSTADAYLHVVAGGTSSGNAFTRYNVLGASNWSTGIDNSDSDKYKISFSSNLGTNDYVTVQQDGNVGIGILPSNQRLEISGNFLLQNNNEIRQKDSGGTQRTIIELDGSNDLNIGGSYAGALKFIGGGSYSEVMRIHDDGNVGIGTVSPSSNLEIWESTADTAASLKLTGDPDAGANTEYANIIFHSRDSSTGANGGEAQIRAYRGGDRDAPYLNFDLADTVGVLQQVMTIHGQNNAVGIGTTAPDYNLHVKGSTSATLGLEGTGGSKDTWEITSSDLGGKAVLNFRNDDVSSTILTLHQDGCVIPGADNTIDLGSSSARWANVYANCTTTGAVIESNLCTNGLDTCPEGSVVIWRDGKLQGTTDAYSHRVMGVTAPGSESPIVMGAENILVTGDIEEGDTIVTSDKYNHGMRGSRSEDLHGKVIAEALESGSGESYVIKGMIRKF